MYIYRSPLELLESRGRRVHGSDMTHVIGQARRAKLIVFQLNTYPNE